MARQLQGVVVSTKMDKTAVVAVTHDKVHPLYRKKYKVTKKYLAHDADNQAQEGQKVTISETRPLSARKRWELVKPTKPEAKS
jgi:small subunit ribosomal protein S17